MGNLDTERKIHKGLEMVRPCRSNEDTKSQGKTKETLGSRSRGPNVQGRCPTRGENNKNKNIGCSRHLLGFHNR